MHVFFLRPSRDARQHELCKASPFRFGRLRWPRAKDSGLVINLTESSAISNYKPNWSQCWISVQRVVDVRAPDALMLTSSYHLFLITSHSRLKALTLNLINDALVLHGHYSHVLPVYSERLSRGCVSCTFYFQSSSYKCNCPILLLFQPGT